MKKIIRIVLTSLTAICCCISAAGCNESNENNVQVSAESTNYLTNMSMTQPEQGATLLSHEQVGDIMFLQYDIGQIRNYYVQNVMTPIYHDGSMTKLTYSESMITSTTISEGLSKAISTTKSLSLTESESFSLQWSLGFSESDTAKVGVGIECGVVSTEAEVSSTFTKSAEIGSTYESINSDTISKSTAESINESYDESYFVENARSIAADIDMSKYEVGYNYALALIADITVYQIVAYNVATGEFYTTYFLSGIDNTNSTIRMVSSRTASFEIPAEVQVTPITAIDIEGLQPASGDGTAESPYLVGTAAQFIAIGNDLDAHYQLTGDIDFQGSHINPIGGENDFSGVLDGNGHTVYNFTVNAVNSYGYAGLFAGNIGTIKNLQIGNADGDTAVVIDSEQNKSIGAVVGLNGGTIMNVHIKNVEIHARKDGVEISDVSLKAGGICGENRGEIAQCSVIDSIVFAEGHATNKWVDSFAGGIAGIARDTDSSISDCFVYRTSISARAGVKDGMFQSQRTAKSVAGGIVGEAIDDVIVSCCVEGGNLLKANSTTNEGETLEHWGAIVAHGSNANVENCVTLYDGKYLTLISNNSAFSTRKNANNVSIWTSDADGNLRLAFEALIG